MDSATFKTMLCASFHRLLHQPNPKSTQPIHYLRPNRSNHTEIRLNSKKDNGFTLNYSDTRYNPTHQTHTDISTGDRILRLVSEFRSLPEPIDRVKRLLHYAAVLPELEESDRIDVNRVTGCTTQVWVDVGMDGSGRMRFRAGSDSEITKGFCSCLIWVFDGAAPEEVLAVSEDDLGAMNVGLVANSRVNTWRNVLVGMQKRTKVLLLASVHGSL